MCIVFVRESSIGDTKEIEFCVVGNKIFLTNVNTDQEESFEQVFRTLTDGEIDIGEIEYINFISHANR